MTDLEKVEMLTKALQDGKTLVNNLNDIVKLIHGIICKNFSFIEESLIGVSISSGNCKVQAPEPPFKITENQLAEYELEDGRTAICNGIKYGNSYCSINSDGTFCSQIYDDGRCSNPSFKFIRKIRDL